MLTALTFNQAELIAEEYPDTIHLLITDVIMPEMNGLDLAKEISRLRPGIKQLFMSGYSTDIIGHQGILDKSTNFIQKTLFHPHPGCPDKTDPGPYMTPPPTPIFFQFPQQSFSRDFFMIRNYLLLALTLF